MHSAEIYDPSTGTFTRTENMVASQAFAAATLLNNGKVFISGPCTDAVSDLFCCRPQLYNPVTGTFSTAEEHGGNSERYPDLNCGAALLPNGKVLTGSPPELYDPATDTVSLAGQRITIGFYGITATLLTNGKVLIAGDVSDFGLSANGELYDPVTEKFTATGNMSHDRAEHTATLLRDGTVLIAGGLFNWNRSSNAEIYDAATGTFASTGDMAVPRADHTATLLRDGRIVIAGGTSWDVPSAELYVPNVLVPAPVVSNLSFEGTSVVAGSSYSVNVSGSNLTPQDFLMFVSPRREATPPMAS